MNYQQNFSTRKKQSHGCIIFFILLICAVGAYLGYRYFTDKAAYDDAVSTLNDGNIILAYQKFNEVEKNPSSLEFMGFKALAREGLRAVAVKELGKVDEIFLQDKYKDAFSAYSLLLSHVNAYQIDDQISPARQGMENSFSKIADPIETEFQVANCQVVFDDGNWILANYSLVEYPINRADLEQKVDGCYLYNFLMDSIITDSPQKAMEKIITFINNSDFDILKTHASKKFQEILNENSFEKIANPVICEYLSENKSNTQSIGEADFLYHCSMVTNEQELYDLSIGYLEEFTKNYPQDSRSQEVVDILADLLIKRANRLGAGALPPPEPAGVSKKGTTVYQVKNDTPYEIRIIFEGPQNIIKIIPACKTCKEFSIRPYYCPSEGPDFEFSLVPGYYSLLVETYTDEDVTPYSGSFTLEDGKKYSDCFFVLVTKY